MKAAAEEARQIRECSEPNLIFLHTHLRQYVLNKYMLPEDSAETDNIRDLTEASLARVMKVAPSLVEELDTARSCAGATSAMVKKALLLQAMERDLGIVLPADKATRARDVKELAELVLDCLRQQEDIPK